MKTSQENPKKDGCRCQAKTEATRGASGCGCQPVCNCGPACPCASGSRG